VAEFLLSLLFSLVAVTATAGLLRTEWDRTRCAYLTFEAAHARLTGAPARLSPQIQVQAGPERVRGQGRCGQAREQVELPWLEGEP
jgi:hypothetical protein